tara:strand:+ start:296 stop:712 length:417 start_codon:yes stop_codon:yes gene_type:complete
MDSHPAYDADGVYRCTECGGGVDLDWDSFSMAASRDWMDTETRYEIKHTDCQDCQAMWCELCRLEKKTRWWAINNDMALIDCDHCGVPMVVARGHGKVLDETAATALVARMFPGRAFTFRKRQRKIQDHVHWHVVFNA